MKLPLPLRRKVNNSCPILLRKIAKLYNKACKVWSKEERQQFMAQANKLIDLLRKERIAHDQ